MIRIGWDANGYPRWIMRGNEKIEGEDYTAVSAAVDPKMLWRAPDGTVVQRTERAIISDRLEMEANGRDMIVLKNLPAPCEIIINQQIVEAPTTSFAVTATAEGPILVQLAGRYCGGLLLMAKSSETLAAEIRVERDRRLAATDWTQVLDVELSASKRLEWGAYRKALRDLPAKQPGVTLETVKWPTPPA